jgi:hypothetical protein
MSVVKKFLNDMFTETDNHTFDLAKSLALFSKETNDNCII